MRWKGKYECWEGWTRRRWKLWKCTRKWKMHRWRLPKAFINLLIFIRMQDSWVFMFRIKRLPTKLKYVDLFINFRLAMECSDVCRMIVDICLFSTALSICICFLRTMAVSCVFCCCEKCEDIFSFSFLKKCKIVFSLQKYVRKWHKSTFCRHWKRMIWPLSFNHVKWYSFC